MPNATRTTAPQDPFEMAARSRNGGQRNRRSRPHIRSAIRRCRTCRRFAAGSGAGARAESRARDLARAGRRGGANARRLSSRPLQEQRREPACSAEGVGNRKRDGERQTDRFRSRPSISRCRRFSCARSPPDDDSQVLLPFEKVLEQFSKLASPQRSGSRAARAAGGDAIPAGHARRQLRGSAPRPSRSKPVRSPTCVEPATAENLAAAEPEPATREKFSLAAASDDCRHAAAPDALAGCRQGLDFHPLRTKPRPRRHVSLSSFHRMERTCPHLREFQPQAGRPFRLASPASPAPTRIPFKMARPSDEPTAQGRALADQGKLRRGGERVPEARRPRRRCPKVEALEPEQCKISLPLKPILQKLAAVSVDRRHRQRAGRRADRVALLA